MKQKKKKRKKIFRKDGQSWQLLCLCLPALIGYVLFYYIPLAVSLIIPFKNYKYSKGILGSQWCGVENFKWVFLSSTVIRAVRNTVLYSLWFILIGLIVKTIIALLLFEIKNRHALKTYQTIITFPNFMSMVIVGYITYAILSPTNGALNMILTSIGLEKIDFYMKASWWPSILTTVNIWKGLGMGSMFYFASLMGVDGSLYEAAEIDGAGRWARTRYISVPHLIPLICVFMILEAGGIFSGNFDLFYVIPRNVTALYETTDVLPTFIYRAMREGNYTSGAAVGLLQSVAGTTLLCITNGVVKKISPENSMF